MREVTASACGVPLRGDESVLEWWWLRNPVDTLKPLNGEHFEGVNFMVCEWYLNVENKGQKTNKKIRLGTSLKDGSACDKESSM